MKPMGDEPGTRHAGPIVAEVPEYLFFIDSSINPAYFGQAGGSVKI